MLKPNQIERLERSTISWQQAFEPFLGWFLSESKLQWEYRHILQKVWVLEPTWLRVCIVFVVPSYRFQLGPIYENVIIEYHPIDHLLILNMSICQNNHWIFTSWITVSCLSKHSSPCGTATVPSPQISRGTFLQEVCGLYFLTFDGEALHFCTGHLVHFCSVV